MEGNEKIRERAHQIWEAEGRPHGRDVDHWEQAQAEMQQTREPGEPEATLPKPRRSKAVAPAK